VRRASLAFPVRVEEIKDLFDHFRLGPGVSGRTALRRGAAGCTPSSSEFQDANVSRIAVLDNGLVARSEYEVLRPCGVSYVPGSQVSARGTKVKHVMLQTSTIESLRHFNSSPGNLTGDLPALELLNLVDKKGIDALV
jgi:hypothetical protein